MGFAVAFPAPQLRRANTREDSSAGEVLVASDDKDTQDERSGSDEFAAIVPHEQQEHSHDAH